MNNIKSVVVLIAGFFLGTSLQAKELKLKYDNVDMKEQAASAMMALGRSATQAQSNYFVVQFQNNITEADKKELENNGFELLQYLPEDAFIVRGKFSNALRIKNNSQIYDVAPYAAEWKLSDEFQTMSVLDIGNKQLLNVRLLPKADANVVLQKISKIAETTVVTASDRYIVVETAKVNALVISEIDGIEFIQLQPQIQNFYFDTKSSGDEGLFQQVPPPDNLGETKTGYESGTKVMNFDSAWGRGFTGAGQIVAMADTGLDTGNKSNLHKDLQTVIGGESVASFGGIDWADPQGHGTHVTGSVVGRGILSGGLIKGGAYNAGYFAQGMWSPIFNNITVPQDLKTMFQSAYSKGARVHTNSWGTVQNLGAYDNFAASVDEFMFQNQEMLIVFAAGNSGVDNNRDGVIDAGSVSSPGTAKNTMTVGASENLMTTGGRLKACGEMNSGDKKWGVSPLKEDKLSNNVNGIACFSSRGPTKDQRIKPDVVAPGTNIVSLRSFHPEATRLWGIYNDNYSWAGGTSMATPLSAGAAAVVREYLTKNGHANPSSALVKGMLMHTATDLFPGQFGLGPKQEIPKQRPNNQEGYGRVNMDAATFSNDRRIEDNKSGIGTGETHSFDFNVTDPEGKLMVTLVYTDAPAAASSGKALVNDLDLAVVTPNGDSIATNDHTNNSELIEISELSSGAYTITVKGTNVPQGKNGKQPFALVVSHVKNVIN